MFFDSHTHCNFQGFDADRDAVLARVRDAGMLAMNVGASFDSSELAVSLAEQYAFCYATVGLHPIHVYDEEFDPVRYQALIDRSAKVRGIGECGIDYYHIKRKDLSMDEIREKQRMVFEQHIDLALKNDLALMIHGRNGAEHQTALKDIYEIVDTKNVSRATVHCFGGDLDEARAFAAKGFYIGITGIVTFDKTGRLAEIVKEIPLEHLLIETDAPYLTPEPYRGKRNEPPYVIEVAKKIADIKKMKVEEVVAMTGENAKKLFKID
ncbi:MAG: TatD family hydrolase [Patescibacteria group bacterium]